MSGVSSTLILAMLRCPAGVAPERREMAGDRVNIGRGTENDWMLPDPERVLSKRHCQLALHDGGWTVTDTSSNGTLLNGNTLDPDAPHVMRSGDRLTLGAYEIEVRFGEDRPAAAPAAAAMPRGAQPAGLLEDRLTSDPFAALDPVSTQDALVPISLPRDFNLLGGAEAKANPPASVADHTSDLQESFRLPRIGAEILPMDWDDDAEEPPVPAPPPPPATPVPAVPAPMPPVPAPASGDSAAAFATFAAGAGVSGTPPADPDAALRLLGAAFRALVVGLRQNMIARATIKGEFRIEQTMIRAAGNNPLKFSADDEDALAALLGTGRQGGMPPARAIAEALRDMRMHEIAVASAMQHAVRDTLGALAPRKVMDALPRTALDSWPGRRKQRGWDAYEAQYAATMAALSDDFDGVFGRSFVRAYEAALADVAAQDPEEHT